MPKTSDKCNLFALWYFTVKVRVKDISFTTCNIKYKINKKWKFILNNVASREGDSFVQWFLKTKEIVSAFKNIGARKKDTHTHT